MIRTLLAVGVALASMSAVSVAHMPSHTMTRMPTPAQPAAIALYPAGTLPSGTTAEIWDRVTATMPDGTHMDSLMARNVSAPMMTPVLPNPEKATGAAVIVAPGGAFLSLSMESEGFQIARWLADHGIAAFVLKYRLNTTPVDEAAFQQVIGQRMGEAIRQGGAVAGIGEPRAYQDALQALKLVRAGRAKWRVDPAQVGIIGFSAGAMTALQSVLTGELHAYERGDHGFGIGRPGTTTTLLMEEFHLWLASRELLGKAK